MQKLTYRLRCSEIAKYLFGIKIKWEAGLFTRSLLQKRTADDLYLRHGASAVL